MMATVPDRQSWMQGASGTAQKSAAARLPTVAEADLLLFYRWQPLFWKKGKKKEILFPRYGKWMVAYASPGKPPLC
jgi:hypothetical protein